MRRVLLLVLVALATLLAAAPSAFAARRVVIFDPGLGPLAQALPSATCQSNQPCNVYDLGVPYVNTWLPCTTAGLPTGFRTDSSLTWCLWFNNVNTLGAPVSTFTFSMTAPGGDDAGQELVCSTSNVVATWDCPDIVPDAGSQFAMTFIANPPVPYGNDFFIGTDFVAEPGDPTGVASVPEPGELGLFGLGLLAIAGAYGWNRRRQVRVVRHRKS